jgi:hypothetical protein
MADNGLLARELAESIGAVPWRLRGLYVEYLGSGQAAADSVGRL